MPSGLLRSGKRAFSWRPLETKVKWAGEVGAVGDEDARRRLGRRRRESRAGAVVLTWRSDSSPSGVRMNSEFQTPCSVSVAKDWQARMPTSIEQCKVNAFAIEPFDEGKHRREIALVKRPCLNSS